MSFKLVSFVVKTAGTFFFGAAAFAQNSSPALVTRQVSAPRASVLVTNCDFYPVVRSDSMVLCELFVKNDLGFDALWFFRDGSPNAMFEPNSGRVPLVVRGSGGKDPESGFLAIDDGYFLNGHRHLTLRFPVASMGAKQHLSASLCFYKGQIVSGSKPVAQLDFKLLVPGYTLTITH